MWGRLTAHCAELDRGDHSANFGCGFLVGALAGAGCLITAADWPIVVGAGPAAGFLAAVFGDRFWTSMVSWFG